MAWYWIVLIIVGYILLAILSGTLMILKEKDNNVSIMAIVWPITLPIFFIKWACDWLVDRYYDSKL
jgi:hypothetical protein